MRLRRVRFSVVASIGSTVLGAILGVAVQGLTRGFHLLIVITAVAAVIAIGTFAALVAVVGTNEQAVNDLKRATSELDHDFDVFGIGVRNDLNSLTQQFGLRVERILLHEIQKIDS